MLYFFFAFSKYHFVVVKKSQKQSKQLVDWMMKKLKKRDKEWGMEENENKNN